MAALALILLCTGLVIWAVVAFLIIATMDIAVDWVQFLFFALWYVGGWGCLIVGAVIGVIALFQSALA